MLRPKVVLVSEELYEVPKGNGHAGLSGAGGSRDNQQSFFSSVLAVIDQSQSQTAESPQTQTQSTQGEDTQSQTTPPEPSLVAAAVDDGGDAAVTTPPMRGMDTEADAPSQATPPVTASPAPTGTSPPDDAGADHATPPSPPDADGSPADVATNNEPTQPKEVDAPAPDPPAEAHVQAATPPAPSRAEDAPRDPSSSKSRTPDFGRKWPEVSTSMLPPPEPRQVTASASTSPATPLQTAGGRAVKEDACAAPFELDPLRQDWVETPMAAEDGNAEGLLPWETLDVPVKMTEAGQQSPMSAAAVAARKASPRASKSPRSAPQSPAAKKATPTRRPVERLGLDLDPAAGSKRRMSLEPPQGGKRAKTVAEFPPPFDASLVTMTNIEEAMRWCATNGRPNHALMDTLFGETHGPMCWKAVGDSQRFRTAVLGFLATDVVDLKGPQGGGGAVVPLTAWVEAALQHCAPPDVLKEFTITSKTCVRCRFKWCRYYMQSCGLALHAPPEGNPFIPYALWNVRDDFAGLRGAHNPSCGMADAKRARVSAKRRQEAAAQLQS